jgi:2-oxo-4-hydroxy-4-carboxy-5-ureidoimidazoline decarboxylase
MTPTERGLHHLNDAEPAVAAEQLSACCASPAWVAAMLAGRPYATLAALLGHGSTALAGLGWPEIRLALDAHPRIGDRVAAEGTEAAWSRREQSAMATTTDEIRGELAEANRAYEKRFDHVFLIFATGRTDTEMLAAARARLGNSDEEEQAILRVELEKIVALRLQRLVSS